MSYEVLDIDGFAAKLGVSSSTVKTWKDKGVLERGRHYYQNGRVVRFFWGELLIRTLLEDNVGDGTTCLSTPSPLTSANAGTKSAGKGAVTPTEGARDCRSRKPTSTLPADGASKPAKGASTPEKGSKRKTQINWNYR